MTLDLLRRRRFAPLFVTQFLGAFNDNVFKNALVVLLTFKAAGWTTLAPELIANLAAGLFILPFFLFSASAGQLADKFDKARLARATKVLEIAIVLLAGAGFWLHSLPLLFTALFLLGLQSALFGPLKYAILPQHLAPGELLGGNALVEAATFVSILLGTILGGVLAAADHGTVWITAVSLLVAFAGYAASLAIPPAPPPAPGLFLSINPLAETWRTVARLRAQPAVLTAILAISWFWLYGALLLAQFPAYTKRYVGGDESVVVVLLAVFTVGIGVGSLLCERLSRGRLEPGWVMVGALGLTLFGLDLWLASPAAPLAADVPLRDAAGWLATPAAWRVLFDLLAIGGFGGLFIVPLYTLMQAQSEAATRARAIAGNNILNALFMVGGAALAALLLSAGSSIPQLFAAAAVANLAVAALVLRRDAVYLDGLRRLLRRDR